MKVLFLTNIPSPYRVDFFQELGSLCDLTVLYELERATDRNANWKSEAAERSYREIYLKPVAKQTSSAWCPSVIEFLKDKNYEVVVVGVYSTLTGMQAIRYLKRHRIPYLLNSDGGFISRQESAWKKRLKTWLISGAKGYLSTGGLSDRYLIYYGAEKQNIYRYPFTSLQEKDIAKNLPTERERKAVRTKLDIREPQMILAVGSFIPRKGFDILLKAASRISRECGIYLVGGEETEEYRIIREEHKLTNVHYIPFLQKEALLEYYRAADLFVFPTREDIWGLVINEAMATGLSVITTERCAAGVEMLEKGCIIPAEDVQKLAEKITELLASKGELQKQGERNLMRSKEYTIENMAKVHLRIFEAFVEN